MAPVTSQSRLQGRSLAILVLAIATGLIHLGKGLNDGLLMFIANGLGYLVLVTVAYALPVSGTWRVLAKWALLALTAITIIGWVLIGERTALVFMTKAIEVLLIILVILDLRQPQ